MVNVDLIHAYYEYFYKKKYKKQNYKLKLSDKDTKLIESFIKLLDKQFDSTVEKEFLYKYFIFQFHYWNDLEKKNGKIGYNNQIDLHLIIGKKAFDRFNQRDTNYDWMIDSLSVVKEYNIKKSDLIEEQTIKNRFVVKDGIDTEAPIKLSAYNTPEGFVNCQDFSSMFNHRSHLCKGCIYKDDCKKLLQQLYPKVYKDRGY